MKFEFNDTLNLQSYSPISKINKTCSNQKESLAFMENLQQCSPSAPSPGLVLFNNEEESDIIFIVTKDINSNQDKWRFPAHSFIIKDASPVFQTIIQLVNQKPMFPTDSNNKPVINLQCRPEIFHMMMSFIYKKDVDICSIFVCIDLLELSIMFMLNNLTSICLKYLYKNVSQANILEVIFSLRQIQQRKDNIIVDQSNFALEDYFENEFNCDNILNELFTKCYQILDSNAEQILKSDQILNLDKESLSEILSRDTLQISSELLAFDCINRWATFQCQKHGKALVSKNKIEVLGKALYSVRYLIMSMEDFTRGPYTSDLLSYEEKNVIINKLKNPNFELPKYLTMFKIEEPRKIVKSNSLERPRSHLSETKNFKRRKSDTHKVRLVMAKRKNSPLKKIRKGLGDVLICMIQLLD